MTDNQCCQEVKNKELFSMKYLQYLLVYLYHIAIASGDSDDWHVQEKNN